MAERTLQDVAAQALALAKTHGAEAADVLVERAQDSEIKVCAGKVLTSTEATRRGLGLRVFVGGRLGFCAATDWTEAALAQGVATAVAMAKVTAADPCHGLTRTALAPVTDALDLYDEAVAALPLADKLAMAHAIEQAARAQDPRVAKFRDSGIGSEVAEQFFAASDGRTHARRTTSISGWCTPVAEAAGQLQTDFWYDSQSHLRALQAPEAIGAVAARRAARMLGARSVASQKVAVIFEAPAAAGLVASMLPALDGDLVGRKASMFAGKLGQTLASPLLRVTDDPHRPRSLGSTAVDGEGVATRPRTLLADGKLGGFLYDGYSARRAGVAPTGSAQRSAGGLPHAGCFALDVAAGTTPEAEILRSVPRALLVTRGLGRGLDTVSGAYSRGASGLWIERGEVVHPVQEVTIAGDFLAMLAAIDAVGDVAVHRGGMAAPMLRVAEMAVGGR